MQCSPEWPQMESKARSGHSRRSKRCWCSGLAAAPMQASYEEDRHHTATSRMPFVCVGCPVPSQVPGCHRGPRCQGSVRVVVPCEHAASASLQTCNGNPRLALEAHFRRRLERRMGFLHSSGMHWDHVNHLPECILFIMSDYCSFFKCEEKHPPIVSR
jgi:hypothetical protein